MEASVEGVMLITKLPVTGNGGEAVERFRLESQCFAHFARSQAAAICNDIRGHSGAAFTITPVNVLDHALTLIAAGKIEINVGPLAALFGEETFEEEIHLDGINGSDAE